MRRALALLVGAAAASPGMVLDSAELRMPVSGLRMIELDSDRAVVVAAFRPTADPVLSVRSAASVAPDGERTVSGDVTVYGYAPSGACTTLAWVTASCLRRDSIPYCSLEVLVPSGIEVAAQLESNDRNRVLFDGLGAKVYAEVFGGSATLLNHSASAYVTAGSVVCTIRDPGPADTVNLTSTGTLSVYYPENISVEVEARGEYGSLPDVEGLDVSYPHDGLWKLTLNPEAGLSSRRMELWSSHRVVLRPLSAYGK